MEFLAPLLVGRPLTTQAIALAFLSGHLLLRFKALGTGRHPRPLLWAAAAWAVNAASEWLVKARARPRRTFGSTCSSSGPPCWSCRSWPW